MRKDLTFPVRNLYAARNVSSPSPLFALSIVSSWLRHCVAGGNFKRINKMLVNL